MHRLLDEDELPSPPERTTDQEDRP
jgi:hypothetical protein